MMSTVLLLSSSVVSHTFAFCISIQQIFDLILHLLLHLEKERFFATNPNDISSTSSIVQLQTRKELCLSKFPSSLRAKRSKGGQGVQSTEK